LRVDLVDGAAVIIFLWVIFSIRWSADPMTGKDTAFHWAMITGVFLALRRRVSVGQTTAIGVAAGLGCITYIAFYAFDVGVYGGYYNPNLIAETSLAAVPLLIPVAATLSGTRWRWYVLAVAAFIIGFLIFFSTSKIQYGVWLALGVFFSIAHFKDRSRKRAISVAASLIAGMTLFIALSWDTPFLNSSNTFKGSFLPRIEYTINTLAVWGTKPVQGVGAGGFNSIFAYHQDDHTSVMKIPMDTPKNNALFETAGAAHNDILQFLANFGIIGALIVLFSIRIAWAQLRVWRSSPATSAGLAVVLTVLANSLLEFPLQMPATLLLFGIGLSWLLPLRERVGEKVFEHVIEFRVVVGLTACCAIATNIWWTSGFLPAQKAFAKTLSTIYVDAHQALAYNEEAINNYPFDDMFRRQYIITLMRWDETSGKRVVEPFGYDKVFEVANTVGPVTGTLILRLQYLLQSGRFVERADEIKRWRNVLLTQSSRVPDVWLLEGVYAAVTEDPDAIEHALKRYTVLTGGVPPSNRIPLVASLGSDLRRLRENSKLKQ
jgi:O-antigen ligase